MRKAGQPPASKPGNRHFIPTNIVVLITKIVVVFVTIQQKKSYYVNDHRSCALLVPTILHPQSRGSIKLSSADPLERPLINPNLLVDKRDREVMKAG